MDVSSPKPSQQPNIPRRGLDLSSRGPIRGKAEEYARDMAEEKRREELIRGRKNYEGGRTKKVAGDRDPVGDMRRLNRRLPDAAKPRMRDERSGKQWQKTESQLRKEKSELPTRQRNTPLSRARDEQSRFPVLKGGHNALQSKFTGKRPSFILYLGVSLIALLKDLLDLVGIGSLPALGTVVTLCFTFLIWMLLFLFDTSGGGSNKKIAQGQILMLIGLVEGIGFGLNFLPIETLTVIGLYLMARRAWRKEQRAAAS